VKNQAKKDYFAAINTRFARCLEPSESCDAEPINSHSIQNAQTLDLLAEDGHVLLFRLNQDKGVPSVSLDRVGRNKASTFEGLCSKHDQGIFRPIDTNPLDTKNTEHLFLLAYRSVLRELHSVMQAAVRMQLSYQAAVKRGAAKADEPSPLGVAATEWILNAYDSYEYKKKFDDALLKDRFDAAEHHSLFFPDTPPTIAASVLFSLDDIEWPDDVARIALNVFPDQEGTHVVFSYLSEERPYALQFLGRILEAEGPYQRYLVSKLILQHTENFVVAPAYFNTWSQEKKQAVEHFFLKTLLENSPNHDDPNLYLF
jgi:hypothetical protein